MTAADLAITVSYRCGVRIPDDGQTRAWIRRTGYTPTSVIWSSPKHGANLLGNPARRLCRGADRGSAQPQQLFAIQRLLLQ